jgi:prepilin-type N-terminal cleavage/methylation domain-containing protein
MRSGFTLIESLVVIAVTTVLLGSLIFSSHGGQGQIAFFKEESTLVGVFLQARSFALDAFQPTLQPSPGSSDDLGVTERVCAWGVHVDPVAGEYVLFRDLDPAGPGSDCTGASKDYTPALNEAFDSFIVHPLLRITCVGILPGSCQSATSIDILFTPPTPKVTFAPDLAGTGESLIVRLELADGTRTSDISVTKGGSVNVN